MNDPPGRQQNANGASHHIGNDSRHRIPQRTFNTYRLSNNPKPPPQLEKLNINEHNKKLDDCWRTKLQYHRQNILANNIISQNHKIQPHTKNLCKNQKNKNSSPDHLNKENDTTLNNVRTPISFRKSIKHEKWTTPKKFTRSKQINQGYQYGNVNTAQPNYYNVLYDTRNLSNTSSKKTEQNSVKNIDINKSSRPNIYPTNEYDKKRKYPKYKKTRPKVLQLFNNQLIQRRKNEKTIPRTDKINMKPESRNLSEIANKNSRYTSNYKKNTNITYYQRKYQSSLFTGQEKSTQLKKMNTTPSAPAAADAALSIDKHPVANPSDSPALSLTDDNFNDDMPIDPLTIISFTEDNDIKAIPIQDTWITYKHNAPVLTFLETEWNLLPDQEKHEELLKLKPEENDKVISSDFTGISINPDTKDSEINKIPKSDCKYLLSSYVRYAGFPDLVPKIKNMKVNELRNNLKDARDYLAKRRQNPPKFTKKKLRSTEIPFVLTHESTDIEIEKTEVHLLTNELKSIFTDNNLYDSIVWDELQDDDIIDMIKDERDNMKKYISEDEEDISENEEEQDKKSEDEDTDSIFDSALDEMQKNNVGIPEDSQDVDSDEDEFLENEEDETKQETPKSFKMNHFTKNEAIYHLPHAKAKEVATYYAKQERESSLEMVTDATTDELYDYLIMIRDHLIREKEFSDFNFGPDTKDQDVKKLNRDTLKSFIHQIFHKNKKPIEAEFFDDKSDFELKLILIQERDMVKAMSDQRTPGQKDKSPIPEATYGNDNLKKKRQNLNGSNIDKFIPKNKSNHTNQKHPKQRNDFEEGDPNIVELKKSQFYIRADISTEGNGTHIPTVVRRFVKALRNSDPTIQILPWDKDDNDLNNILDNEDQIPDDANEILTWVRGLNTNKNRIYFSIRVENTIKFSELKTDIFGWCRTNRCYIKFDFIESERIFACGWLCGIHPRLFNRNALKGWLDFLGHGLGMKEKIKIYPRTIYSAGTGAKKTITNAIVIEGASEHAREIMKFLYSVPWETEYRGAQFVPFRQSETFTSEDQKKAMEFNNEYLHSTYRKIVRIEKPLKEITLENGNPITFREWLVSGELHNMQMIDGVEDIKKGLVRVIYNKKHQKGVDYIMENLYENMCDAFGDEVAEDILGDEFDVVTQYNNEMEDSHAEKIKAAWGDRTPTNSRNPVKKHTVFFGSNKSAGLYDKPSFSAAVKQSTPIPSKSEEQIAESKKENDDLRNTVEEMRKKFEDFEKRQVTFERNLKTTLKAELMKEFGTMIQEFKNEVTGTLEQCKNLASQMDTSISNFEQNLIAREQRMNEQNLNNFRTIAAELFPKQITPSEVSQQSVLDLHGGAQ